MLETLLGQIGELYSCPDAFATHNKESKEIFMNNYCSAAQPLLYAVGTECIDDQLMKKIVDLVIFIFSSS